MFSGRARDTGKLSQEVGHAPSCIMVEAINQSGARIFSGVNLEECRSRDEEDYFACFLGIIEFGYVIA